MSEIETLICTVGGDEHPERHHEWTRDRKRGVKPKLCPDHKVAKQTVDAEERLRRMREGRERHDAEERQRKLAAVLASSGESCHCDIEPTATLADLMTMRGCKDPQFVCNTLDRARRALGH